MKQFLVPFIWQALPDHEDEIPETVRTVQLIKDLAREIRLVEVRSMGKWELFRKEGLEILVESQAVLLESQASVFGMSTQIEGWGPQ